MEVPGKSGSAHFGPFLVQICHFLAQNQHFGLYIPNGSLNFADLCYRKLWSFIGKFRFTFPEKSSPAHFGPFLVQICHFLAQNQHLSLYLPNGSLNFVAFWYGNYSYSLLLKNWGFKSGKNLSRLFWAVFAPNFYLFGVQHIFEAC